jgi:hypothetical protein
VTFTSRKVRTVSGWFDGPSFRSLVRTARRRSSLRWFLLTWSVRNRYRMVKSTLQRMIANRLPKFLRWLARSSKPIPSCNPSFELYPPPRPWPATQTGHSTGHIGGGRTKHGLNPSFVIYDELAQAKNRELYDVLDTSMGARAEPLFAVISTQSNDPEHILSVS